MKKSVLYFALLALISLAACSKNEVEPEFNPSDRGSLTLEFDNYAGTTNFAFGQEYTNAVGEKFKVDLLQYFISNIKLKDETGKEYVVPQDQSYFLVTEQDAASQKITLTGLPAGNYAEVTFTIGVDSLRNTAEVSKRTGALDIGGAAKGMYWSWNSGYIFFKMEGTSVVAPVGTDGQQRFRYHIGGFGGFSSRTINNVRSTTLSLGKDRAKVRKDVTPKIHLVVDILKALNGTTNVSIATNPTVMFSPFSVNIANNYVKMFEYHHVHNN